MAKRYISLLLILALLPACLAVPVMAEETELPYYDVLDYNYVNLSDSNNVFLSSGQAVSFYLTSSQPLTYFEVLVRSTNLITSVYAWNGSAGLSVNVDPIGDSLYRIYGTFPSYWATYFLLEFTFDNSDSSYLTFHSCRVWNSSFDYTSTTVSGTVNALGLPNQLLYPNYPSSPYVNWSYSSWEQYQGAYTDGMFTGRFYYADWQKFDFCEMQLNAIVKSISSVAAYLGDQVVPVDVSIIENSGSTPGNFFINVVVDLRSFQRNTDDVLTIVIDGIADFEMTNQISIFDAVGKVLVSDPSPWLVWFNRLQGWLSSGFSSVTASLTTLGNNISSYISAQTSSLTTAIVNQQTAIINAQQAQHEADRQLWNSISSNVSTWISAQTSSINGWLKGINDNVVGGFGNVGKWLNDQTVSITNSISSWGQSLKDSIDALPKKIAEELKALIVPADGAVESMASKSEALVSDRFGGVFEGAQIVDNWAGQLQSQAATQILTIPVVNMNILGSNFPIGGWEVDLIPDGFEIIFESVKIIIDILATAAFVNGIKNRLERTLER